MNKYGYEITLSKEVKNLLNNYDDNKYAPKKEEIFKALALTPLQEVKVVWLGQDPYPTFGDAMGLSFSINKGVKNPRSLNNMFKELESDLNIKRTNGDLTDWAKQGVLLLNTILTVEIGNANSHKKLGWQQTTDQIIKQLSDQENIIFVLLGNQAHKYQELISDNNIIIKYSHPSPLSARHSFFGSKLYSEINDNLIRLNKKPIIWGHND